MIQGKMDKIVLTEKGIYNAADYNLDGFNEVEVQGGGGMRCDRFYDIINNGVEIATPTGQAAYQSKDVFKLYAYMSNDYRTLGMETSTIHLGAGVGALSREFVKDGNNVYIGRWSGYPYLIGVYLVRFLRDTEDEEKLIPVSAALVGGCDTFGYYTYLQVGRRIYPTQYTTQHIETYPGTALYEKYPKGYSIICKRFQIISKIEIEPIINMNSIRRAGDIIWIDVPGYNAGGGYPLGRLRYNQINYTYIPTTDNSGEIGHLEAETVEYKPAYWQLFNDTTSTLSFRIVTQTTNTSKMGLINDSRLHYTYPAVSYNVITPLSAKDYETKDLKMWEMLTKPPL